MKRAIGLFLLLTLPGTLFCQQLIVTSPGDGYQVRVLDMNSQFPKATSPETLSITKIQQAATQMTTRVHPHTIPSSGTVTIRFSRYCDLNVGHEMSAVPGCDFW